MKQYSAMRELDVTSEQVGVPRRAATVAVQPLQALHYHVACRRQDFLHKLTTRLVKSHDLLVIEDLQVAGMSKNRRLSKSFSDVALGEFRRQLEYKSQWYGCTLVVSDRWFASTKPCSLCGTKNTTLTLSDRVWTCGYCGAAHDRDLNAALNLDGSCSVTARGADVRHDPVVQVASKRCEQACQYLLAERER